MNRDRFKDAIWYGKYVKVTIGGAGGIGSWLAFFLAKAGFEITQYDFDTVEEHNLGGQLFFADSIGELKTVAVENLLSEFVRTGYRYNGRISKIEPTTTLRSYMYNGMPIYVSAFDNMEARKVMFNKFIEDSDQNALFVDGRLLMEQMRIYVIKKNQSDRILNYIDKHLFDDSEVEEAPCTMKQVSHSAAMIASHMTAFITNSVANHFVWKDNVFKVPYIWDYVIPTNCVTETYDL
jgi:tRNA A37 threonylcarbamoyladenosine dehydratase